MRALLSFLLSAPVVWAQAGSGVSFPDALRSTLALTDAQISTMSQQNAAFDQFNLQQGSRTFGVQVELTALLQAAPLDALAVGLHYVEIEVIRREVEDRRLQLRTDHAKVLTDAQRVKLQALDDAQQLLGREGEAECQGLIAAPEDRQFLAAGGFASDPIPTAAARATACILGTDFPADLTAYLALTPAQLDSVQQLEAENTRVYSDLQQSIARLRTEASRLTAAELLDPGAIGQAYAEIENISRQQQDRISAWRAALAKVLTPAQAAKVQALVVARSQISLIKQAVCEDLLGGGVSTTVTTRPRSCNF